MSENLPLKEGIWLSGLTAGGTCLVFKTEDKEALQKAVMGESLIAYHICLKRGEGNIYLPSFMGIPEPSIIKTKDFIVVSQCTEELSGNLDEAMNKKFATIITPDKRLTV